MSCANVSEQRQVQVDDLVIWILGLEDLERSCCNNLAWCVYWGAEFHAKGFHTNERREGRNSNEVKIKKGLEDGEKGMVDCVLLLVVHSYLEV